jgi:hypothetical protein
MTRDAAAQAVHERLEHAVASMPTFDVEAGWAAFVTQLEPPIAPVIPIRRRRPRRTVALAIAAAVLVGGSAFATTRQLGGDPVTTATASPLFASDRAVGPHLHPMFADAPGLAGGGGANTGAGPDRTNPGSGGPAGGGAHGSEGPATSGEPNQDSPDDIDHGSGNDGQHDDNGGGNDAGGSTTSTPGHSGSAGEHGSSGSHADGSQGAETSSQRASSKAPRTGPR